MKTLQEIKEEVAKEKGIDSWLRAGYEDKREMLWPEVCKRACEECIKLGLVVPRSMSALSNENIVKEILIKLHSTN